MEMWRIDQLIIWRCGRSTS